MNILKPSEIEAFIERFYSCYDGLIRSFSGQFPTRDKTSQVTIVISTQDSQKTGDDRWVNLHLKMIDVKEFTLKEPPNITHQVIYGGLHVSYYDEMFFVDVGSLTDEPENVEEYRACDFYFAARSLMWEVVPYEE